MLLLNRRKFLAIESKTFDLICEGRRVDGLRIYENRKGYEISISLDKGEVKWLLMPLTPRPTHLCKASIQCRHCAVRIHFVVEAGGGKTYVAALQSRGKLVSRVGQTQPIRERVGILMPCT